jgi:hypothetical protein
VRATGRLPASGDGNGQGRPSPLKKKSRIRKKNNSNVASSFKGFDLGEHQTILSVADFSFIEFLNNAKVFACAYGVKGMEEFPQPVPFLGLIGENRAGFEQAFKVFAGWGCEADGDIVDIHIALRNDGTYQLWVGPETERTLHRIVPEASLYRADFFNVVWVKKFDTTNPQIQQLHRHCDSAISPVLFTAAVGDSQYATRDSPRFTFVDGLPRLIKLDLKITAERDKPGDPRFHVKEYDIPKKERDDPRKVMSPYTYCWRRRKTIDIAFPVSRERVRRAGLVGQIRSLPGYTDVSETQVVQAAINLMLSSEIAPDDRHYSKITDKFMETVWSKITNRRELADNGTEPTQYELAVIAQQIDLDIRHVLRQRGVPVSGAKFSTLQGLFRRKGYIDD